MSKYDRVKHIAELQIKTDKDVRWEVENSTAQEIYATAFAEGFAYCDNIYLKTLDSWGEEDKPKESK